MGIAFSGLRSFESFGGVGKRNIPEKIQGNKRGNYSEFTAYKE